MANVKPHVWLPQSYQQTIQVYAEWYRANNPTLLDTVNNSDRLTAYTTVMLIRTSVTRTRTLKNSLQGQGQGPGLQTQLVSRTEQGLKSLTQQQEQIKLTSKCNLKNTSIRLKQSSMQVYHELKLNIANSRTFTRTLTQGPGKRTRTLVTRTRTRTKTCTTRTRTRTRTNITGTPFQLT